MKAEDHTELIQAWIDLIYAELKTMGKDGHFDEYEANTNCGAVQYELAKLRDSITKQENSE